ncbi:hypothetical protein CPC08DRAFT_754629 [Agrocybe pediades]|nr:hypothetical protein CPC08DRAFT_754629 [Agrocybe pediades]
MDKPPAIVDQKPTPRTRRERPVAKPERGRAASHSPQDIIYDGHVAVECASAESSDLGNQDPVDGRQCQAWNGTFGQDDEISDSDAWVKFVLRTSTKTTLISTAGAVFAFVNRLHGRVRRMIGSVSSKTRRRIGLCVFLRLHLGGAVEISNAFILPMKGSMLGDVTAEGRGWWYKWRRSRPEFVGECARASASSWKRGPEGLHLVR